MELKQLKKMKEVNLSNNKISEQGILLFTTKKFKSFSDKIIIFSKQLSETFKNEMIKLSEDHEFEI